MSKQVVNVEVYRVSEAGKDETRLYLVKSITNRTNPQPGTFLRERDYKNLVTRATAPTKNLSVNTTASKGVWTRGPGNVLHFKNDRGMFTSTMDLVYAYNEDGSPR